MAQNAEAAAGVGDLRTVYQITKELISSHSQTDQPVMSSSGQLLSSEEE